VLLLLTTVIGPSYGQPAGPQDVENLYHWSYSAAFGTGAYRVGEERVFVLRVSPKVPLAKVTEKQVSLNLNLLFAVGVQDLDLEVVDISDSLKTFSFVPGLGLRYPVNDRWALRPFAHYGWGKEMDGGESARIWFYGINSRYTFFDKADLEIDLLNGLQWFAYSTNDNVSDRFGRLVTGVEGMYPLRCWSIYGYPLYLKPHIIHFWYFDDLGFNQILQPPVEVKQEIEFGLALGSEEKINLAVFQLDRFGVGYRVGDNSRGVRFFVGSAFD